jgi:predicted nucleic acid-binding protein
LSDGLVYLDSSAIVKLVIAEPGSVELRSYVDAGGSRTTSIVSLVEASRAVERADPALMPRVDEALKMVNVIDLDREVARLAARIRPPRLRSLDAIHLASAALLGSSLLVFITYDRRMADAAREADLAVASPGVSLGHGRCPRPRRWHPGCPR